MTRQEKAVDNQTLFCSQLMEQKSLYPLYPVAGMPLDTSRIQSLSFAQLPDIQIVATDKMKFIKEVNGVLFVSPGPLALGNGGGTYARLTVYPFKKEYIESGLSLWNGSFVVKEEKTIENKVASRTKAQIMVL